MSRITKTEKCINPYERVWRKKTKEKEPDTTEPFYNAYEQPFLDNFFESLPNKPYCSNELGFLKIRPKEIAIKHKYIQFNPPHMVRWIVLDVDHPSSYLDWKDQGGLFPNVAVYNPANYHCHLYFGIKTPVCTFSENPNVSMKAIRYLASIEMALTKKFKSDPGYTGLIAKNPAHKAWDSTVWGIELFELGDLAGWLDLTPYKDGRKKLPPIGLGRNCNLFDRTRSWAYTAIGKGNFRSKEKFTEEVLEFALDKNQDFINPLQRNEVRHIAKSIGKWTFLNMSPEGKKEWHSRKGKIGGKVSGKVRKEKADLLYHDIRVYKHNNPRATQTQIAIVFAVSQKTVSNALSSTQ